MMRFATVALITTLMAGSAPAGSPVADSSVEKIIAREFATWPKEPGGAAVAVRINGRTLFFNEGTADQAIKRTITSDSLYREGCEQHASYQLLGPGSPDCGARA